MRPCIKGFILAGLIGSLYGAPALAQSVVDCSLLTLNGATPASRDPQPLYRAERVGDYIIMLMIRNSNGGTFVIDLASHNRISRGSYAMEHSASGAVLYLVLPAGEDVLAIERFEVPRDSITTRSSGATIRCPRPGNPAAPR